MSAGGGVSAGAGGGMAEAASKFDEALRSAAPGHGESKGAACRGDVAARRKACALPDALNPKRALESAPPRYATAGGRAVRWGIAWYRAGTRTAWAQNGP